MSKICEYFALRYGQIRTLAHLFIHTIHTRVQFRGKHRLNIALARLVDIKSVAVICLLHSAYCILWVSNWGVRGKMDWPWKNMFSIQLWFKKSIINLSQFISFSLNEWVGRTWKAGLEGHTSNIWINQLFTDQLLTYKLYIPGGAYIRHVRYMGTCRPNGLFFTWNPWTWVPFSTKLSLNMGPFFRTSKNFQVFTQKFWKICFQTCQKSKG